MQSIPKENLVDWHLLRLESQGYTVVPDAVPPSLLAGLRRRFDELIAGYKDVPSAIYYPETGAIDLNRLFEIDPIFEELMDLPSVFSIAQKAFDGDITLLGGSIGNYNPPHAPARSVWHHDGEPYIRLTFLLSDLGEEGGPTAVLPGTHHRKATPPPWMNGGDRQPREVPGMVLVTGQAGTCMINNTLIWHTGTPNRSDHPRRLIWVVYKRSSWPVTSHKHLLNSAEFIDRQTNPQRRVLCGLTSNRDSGE